MCPDNNILDNYLDTGVQADVATGIKSFMDLSGGFCDLGRFQDVRPSNLCQDSPDHIHSPTYYFKRLRLLRTIAGAVTW